MDVAVCTSAMHATALIASTRTGMNSYAMSRMRVDDKDGCLWEPVALVGRPAGAARPRGVRSGENGSNAR